MDYKQQIFKAIENFQDVSDIDVQKKAYQDLSMLLKSIMKKEEKIHVEFNIPDKEIHMALHDEFARDLFSFEDQYFTESGITPANVLKISEYINLWIEIHEDKYDNFIDSFIRISEFAA